MPQDERLADWCLDVLRDHADSDSPEIPADTPEHVLQREAARLEIHLRNYTSNFINNGEMELQD
jgi:hypothetical protein